MRISLQLSKRLLLVLMLSVIALLYIQMRPSFDESEDCSYANRGAELDSLFEGTNATFQSAGRCDHCHGYDPEGIASVSGKAGDINVVDDWSSTMMANSAKDPFWRAKVSHEVMTFPSLQQEIETTCTKCHAPMGNYDASMNGNPHYSIAEMLGDGVALDGVSCLACHKQMPQPEVAQHTGKLYFNTTNHVYGQYESPLISPMAEYTGLIPEHAQHISDSKLCAGCHSLITETVDNSGNITDNKFIEQATWHEWLNSSYSVQGTSCQSCHMPHNEGPNVILAAGYDTEPRPGFALHTLAGGNSLMLRILRDNREALDIYASDAQFNETINATNDLLQNHSVLLEVDEINRTADTLFIDVKLTNLTGHKLPSGYPSRRMSVEFVVNDDMGNEIFRSGGFDENYYETGEDNIEPHHNLITDEGQVQIYEMVMGDMDGNETTILNKAYNSLKDNRLVPTGFSSTHPQYDTTQVILGINDADFNHDPTEGSGTDVIHYHIPLNGYTGHASVATKAWYQSLPPTWMEEIFASSTPEIESFETMFSQADRSPVLMRSNTITVAPFVGVNELANKDFVRIYQRAEGELVIGTLTTVNIACYDINGKLIAERPFNAGNHNWRTNLASGTYILNITDKTGRRMVKKVVMG